MNINRIALAAFATTLCISPVAYAEDSERETPIEEYELAQKTDPLPEAVKAYLAQLEASRARASWKRRTAKNPSSPSIQSPHREWRGLGRNGGNGC